MDEGGGYVRVRASVCVCLGGRGHTQHACTYRPAPCLPLHSPPSPHPLACPLTSPTLPSPSSPPGLPPADTTLLLVVGLCEAIRTVFMALLAGVHQRENLSSL